MTTPANPSAPLIRVPGTAPLRVRESAPAVAAASQFVAEACGRDPSLLPALLESADLTTAVPEEALGFFESRAPAFAAGEEPDEATVMAALRRWRTREMVRLAWRDLAGFATIEETLREQSAFAQSAIRQAQLHAGRMLTRRHGIPRSAAGAAQDLIVVGMGKLGGGELNFSSDIDLVFLFPEPGETDGPRSLANEDFFTRLGQLLIRLLETRTAEGFVFRVDMRLRPFGDSGALVASFAAFEDYLQGQGRDWERYAWVKARPMTGEAAYARIYESAVRPFVYRRYLDYGVFESLRAMKALIEREVERREMAQNVKLGPGGIREIEFLAQSLQLLRGGREPWLRTPSLLKVLPLLDRSRLLPPGAADELRAAYGFLRRVENRLQERADEQTHVLPTAEAAREQLARALGLPHWRTLQTELDGHRERVSRLFHAVVFGAAGAADPAGDLALDLDSAAAGDEQALAASLGGLGWTSDPVAGAQRLLRMREDGFVRRLDAAGRSRLQALLPQLLTLIARVSAPLATLERVLKIIEAIGKRSAYYALLNERADARVRLVEICGYGDFLARQIATSPLLLDELIDQRLFEALPDRRELAQELDLEVDPLQEEDPERQVEALRHFQQAAVFRVAVADLSGRLPLMRVSDWLTDIAELIVERVLELSLRQICAQWGVPKCGEGPQRRPVRICVVGYGKLGGRELGYGSDLDVVFLHDSAGERQETEGDRSIDNQLFFVRLAQRIMHLLTMHSAAGRLYEVDVRLRPSGKGGLLVTSIGAFAEYQEREAWTWEHQALLHARAVAGDPGLRAHFEAVRVRILRQHVDRGQLRAQVRRMRERMRRELSRSGADEFDIKQDAGGVADIEFLAQYWALTWAQAHPPVITFSDTIRQLESVASADLVPQRTVDTLTAAYRAYRARTHRISLEGGANVVAADQFAAERSAVSAIWQAAMVE
ncbi:MAG TPA: bifunctional [glutamate--ammonia ligase]-adenylyl-L-tyrosine phosphorylase/[glutamate--ammonia-ligase] adenylyltransferase [Steroidobacteraceae bacterium]|nr:bifunctional [glutamate--ammonia ligase]-adenylyl-L-tyrosine phosphorylase/[glutamate--ammonia-ligase] adenylyltransferase [Steroidobacteraceae bacterium]